jgi:hypothetical protein
VEEKKISSRVFSSLKPLRVAQRVEEKKIQINYSKRLHLPFFAFAFLPALSGDRKQLASSIREGAANDVLVNVGWRRHRPGAFSPIKAIALE